jgi:uncharacterized protein (DUF2236 family)
VDAFMAMMNDLEPRFEPHPIIFEFLDIIQSGRAAPGVPRFLHRAIARASVSLLPAHIRRKLDLGPRYDLTRIDRTALRIAGRLADRHVDRTAPHCQASVRLGLPYDFLFKSPAEQRRLLTA